MSLLVIFRVDCVLNCSFQDSGGCFTMMSTRMTPVTALLYS